MKPVRKPDCTYTYGDYRQWPDDERWELINGEAYAMTGPNRAHQTILGEIFRQIANYLLDKPCQVFVAPFDVLLPEKDEADDLVQTVVQPDIIVVCDDKKLDDKCCRGAPDWVIEILSPSTASHDHVRKRNLYERHGVREYWLVHPLDRVLTRYRLENGVFSPASIVETQGETSVGILPELAIQWAFLVP